MNNLHPVLVFYLFLFLLTFSVFAPLHFFWLYFVLAGCILAVLRIHPKIFIRKTFLYLLAGNLTLFIYFSTDAWLVGRDIAAKQQWIIVLNVYFRMASAVGSVLLYREAASMRDVFFVMNRHRLPVRLILLLMISFRMIQLFIHDIILFTKHFRFRLYRGMRTRYVAPWTKSMLMYYFRQAEMYAQYLCLKNLHTHPATIRTLFHDTI